MQSSRKFFRLSFFSLWFGTFLNWVSYGLIYPLFAISIFDQEPLFLADVSNAMRGLWLGILIASTPLAQFFTSPFIGALSDQFGRKRILQITALIMVIGNMLAMIGIWEQSFVCLLIGRTVTGMGAGNVGTINSAVADMSTLESKAKNFGLITMANGLGFAVGPFLGGKLSVLGFDYPFIFSVLMSFISFLLYTFFFAETLARGKKLKMKMVSRMKDLLKTANTSYFRYLFLAFFVFCFGWSFYWEFIPVTWIKLYGLNASQIGNFYGFGSAIYVVSSGLLIRPILKRYQPLPILFTCFLALGACLLLLIHETVSWYWTFVAIQQFLVALIFPVGTALVSNAVSNDRQGGALGAFQSLQSIAFAITPFLGGVLLDVSDNMPLILGGVSIILAGLALLPILRARQRKIVKS